MPFQTSFSGWLGLGDWSSLNVEGIPLIESTLLDHVPLWAFFLATLGITLVAGECGYRFGRRRQSKTESQKNDALGSIVGATLGLLAFLLAFTFGLAASRYDSRREIFQEEANAVRATYLRASLLPEPQSTKVRGLVREYVDVRLEANKPDASIADAIRKSEQLQKELWKNAIEVGRHLEKPGAPNSDMMALFVDSLNQTIDAHAKRVGAVVRARVPAPIWGGLILLALISVFVVGYHMGITGTSRPLVGVGMIVCFAITMYLIADLDRPLEGLIQVNNQGMIDLRASMNDIQP